MAGNAARRGDNCIVVVTVQSARSSSPSAPARFSGRALVLDLSGSPALTPRLALVLDVAGSTGVALVLDLAGRGTSLRGCIMMVNGLRRET
jgi:hypothetical protein